MTSVSSTAMPSNLPQAVMPWASASRDGVVAAVAEVSSSFSVNAANAPAAQSAPAAPAAKKATASTLSKQQLAIQVQDLQIKMDKLNPALAFVVDQSSGRALIQLTDRDTKEVIQQFPTEAAIQISKALDRFEKGILVSRTA
jgi:flagellar protein FlaG